MDQELMQRLARIEAMLGAIYAELFDEGYTDESAAFETDPLASLDDDDRDAVFDVEAIARAQEL